MLRSCEGLLGRDQRTLGKDLRTFGGDRRTLGRDPRTHLMVRALGLEAALASLLSVVLVGMLLAVVVMAVVLLILVATLVRVEVRLVGRGPGSPLASRPARGQRLGSVGGWGGSQKPLRGCLSSWEWA